ncbi:hypothetical protein C5167_005239 [Papaver somniferum]|uniref:Uncharacterized protein n=1 Tax=Papaver somniferum TaxID=3469 RepID=A0A4Y7J9Z8_PAPSO|nr:uncharacterized protein LOC113273782 [Papaver somniferum]RZC57923.1 hypothetical protein C5167_005239 [Papaver somniferum]
MVKSDEEASPNSKVEQQPESMNAIILEMLKQLRASIKSEVTAIVNSEMRIQRQQMSDSLLESLPTTVKFKGAVKSEVEKMLASEREQQKKQICDSLLVSLPNLENFKGVVKSEVETVIADERERMKQQLYDSVLESLPSTEKFKEVITTAVVTVLSGEREGQKEQIKDSVLASLPATKILKLMIKNQVNAALNNLQPTGQAGTHANQNHDEAEMFSSKIAEKSNVEKAESKLQRKIAETMNVPVFMSLLVGFTTIVSQQPLQTHKELQLLIALMVVIVFGTLLYLYSVWSKLATLKSRVTSLGEKRRILNNESVALVQGILAPEVCS